MYDTVTSLGPVNLAAIRCGMPSRVRSSAIWTYCAVGMTTPLVLVTPATSTHPAAVVPVHGNGMGWAGMSRVSTCSFDPLPATSVTVRFLASGWR